MFGNGCHYSVTYPIDFNDMSILVNRLLTPVLTILSCILSALRVFMHSSLGCGMLVSLIVVTVGKYFVTHCAEQRHFSCIFDTVYVLSLADAPSPLIQKLLKSDTSRMIYST